MDELKDTDFEENEGQNISPSSNDPNSVQGANTDVKDTRDETEKLLYAQKYCRPVCPRLTNMSSDPASKGTKMTQDTFKEPLPTDIQGTSHEKPLDKMRGSLKHRLKSSLKGSIGASFSKSFGRSSEQRSFSIRPPGLHDSINIANRVQELRWFDEDSFSTTMSQSAGKGSGVPDKYGWTSISDHEGREESFDQSKVVGTSSIADSMERERQRLLNRAHGLRDPYEAYQTMSMSDQYAIQSEVDRQRLLNQPINIAGPPTLIRSSDQVSAARHMQGMDPRGGPIVTPSTATSHSGERSVSTSTARKDSHSGRKHSSSSKTTGEPVRPGSMYRDSRIRISQQFPPRASMPGNYVEGPMPSPSSRKLPSLSAWGARKSYSMGLLHWRPRNTTFAPWQSMAVPSGTSDWDVDLSRYSASEDEPLPSGYVYPEWCMPAQPASMDMHNSPGENGSSGSSEGDGEAGNGSADSNTSAWKYLFPFQESDDGSEGSESDDDDELDIEPSEGLRLSHDHSKQKSASTQ